MLKRDVEVFKQAILNEVEGYEFYKMAAYNTPEEEVKKAFLNLANEELKHIDWLKDAFKKLSGNPEDQTTLALIENPPSPQIFKWDNLQNKNANLSVSVFGIGIEMERASVSFYEKAKAETPYEVAKQLFDVLAKWEKVHLDQFSAVYEDLIKDWWSDQGFEPF
ncbi:MAG: rubrerythrin [Clostridiales bacterium 38-18]|nr:MAG: rubrerythrin [Clostridiales bacterium 38-18]